MSSLEMPEKGIVGLTSIMLPFVESRERARVVSMSNMPDGESRLHGNSEESPHVDYVMAQAAFWAVHCVLLDLGANEGDLEKATANADQLIFALGGSND